MKKLWRDYALSIVLATLFIVAWLLQTVFGWVEYVGEQREHGGTPSVFGDDGYLWKWGEATFENWQSEYLQLFSFVVLTTFLIHRKSHESRDSDEEMQAALSRIEKQVKDLQQGKSS